jgi:hypothetical protein
MSALYGCSLFGFSLMIVAIFPSKKASATAASLVHLASYYFALCCKGYQFSFISKILCACLIPNCALSFMLDHLLHCEIEGGTGLIFPTAKMPY